MKAPVAVAVQSVVSDSQSTSISSR